MVTKQCALTAYDLSALIQQRAIRISMRARGDYGHYGRNELILKLRQDLYALTEYVEKYCALVEVEAIDD